MVTQLANLKKPKVRRVLVVSPNFPPVNGVDHHRIRMSLPYLGEFGWSVTVLAVRPEATMSGSLDPLLERTIPDDIIVKRVYAIPSRITRVGGIGNLGMRALPFLLRAGNKLLRQSVDGNRQSEIERRPFDLVFFSTTQFPVMILGPIWKRKFGVPYVVDFQDPWLDDYYTRTGTPPPGGGMRYRLSRKLASYLEPRVMRDVSHVISVSPAYVETLRSRYPHLDASAFTVLPFGAPKRDFEMLEAIQVRQTIFDPADGKEHWVYIGRGGHDMTASLHLLFASIAEARRSNPDGWTKVRLHFVGTSYAPPDRALKTVAPIAADFGLSDIVEEQTSRVPYFQALKSLTDASLLLVIGSDSPSYSASKLYPYMLAKKPMLAVLHHQSPAVEILRKCNAGEVVTFDPAHPEPAAPNMTEALKHFAPITDNKEPITENSTRFELDWAEFRQYTAYEMTRRECQVFDKAISVSACANVAQPTQFG